MDRGGLPGRQGVDDRRGRAAARPPERDLVPHRQRLRARRDHREGLPRRAHRGRLAHPGHRGGVGEVLAAAGRVRHEDERPVRLRAAELLVRQGAHRQRRRVELQLRDQRRAEHPDDGHAQPDDVGERAEHVVDQPVHGAVPPVVLVDVRQPEAVRRRARQALRRHDEPGGLHPQGAARAVRERAGGVRVARPRLHRLVEPVDGPHLLDAQQRLDVAALAAVRHLPRPERRVLRRQEGQREAAHPVLLRLEVRRGGQPRPRGRERADGEREAVLPRRHGEVQPDGHRRVGRR